MGLVTGGENGDNVPTQKPSTSMTQPPWGQDPPPMRQHVRYNEAAVGHLIKEDVALVPQRSGVFKDADP